MPAHGPINYDVIRKILAEVEVNLTNLSETRDPSSITRYQILSLSNKIATPTQKNHHTAPVHAERMQHNYESENSDISSQ